MNMTDIPASAARLEHKAREHGWTASHTCSSGQINGRDIASVAVRLCRDDVRCVALWENGAFRTALRQAPFGRMSSRELTALVTT
jgi:hypothetical protein